MNEINVLTARHHRRIASCLFFLDRLVRLAVYMHVVVCDPRKEDTAMKNLLLATVLFLFSGCAPFLAGPFDSNSSLVIGRIVMNNNFAGNFSGILPQGVIEKGLEIEVESRDGKEIHNITTGDNGYFLIPNISQNSYYVRRVAFEGSRNNQRERRSQDVRRLSFVPVPGKVLYIGSLFIDVSDRGFATYRETHEDEMAKAHFFRALGSSPWASRTFFTAGSTPVVKATPESAPRQTSESKLTNLTIAKPEWKPGNQWRYGWKRPGTSGTLTREVLREESFAGVPAYVVRAGKNENFYAKEVLGLLATKAGGKITLRRDVPYQPLSWPLEVGKEWKNSYVLERLEEKSSQRYDNRIFVSKVEAVQVPAGTFETFKIEVYGAHSGNLQTEYWYSPQVKWFVRTRTYEQDGVREEELLNYKID